MTPNDPSRSARADGQEKPSVTLDESRICAVIELRRLAWNADDVAAYAALLTPDVQLTSATGKTAVGRDEVLRLYAEQRQGVYRDASLASTVVNSIRVLADGHATAQAAFVLVGVRAADGTARPPIEGVNAYTLVYRSGAWLIASIHGTPITPINPITS